MFAQKLLLPVLAVITSVAGKSSSNPSLPQECASPSRTPSDLVVGTEENAKAVVPGQIGTK